MTALCNLFSTHHTSTWSQANDNGTNLNIHGYISKLSVEVPKEFVGSNNIDCLTWCKAVETLGTFSDRQQAVFIRSYQAKEGYSTENAPFLKIIPHQAAHVTLEQMRDQVSSIIRRSSR
jgi:hypothetical protein